MPWIAAWFAALTTWQIIQYLITIAMVLYAIIQATLKDKSPAIGVRPGSPLDQSNTFGFDNFTNQISKEYPLSIIYGEYKHAGNRFYTEISGSHNNNNVIEICIGIGEGEINSLIDPENNLKLNDIQWKNITSAIKSYTLHTGTANQTVDDRILASSITVDNNTIIPENGGEVVLTGIATDTIYIRLGLQAPYGLYKTEPYVKTHQIKYTLYYRLFGSTPWLLANPSFIVNSTNNKFEFTECNYAPVSGNAVYDDFTGQWIVTFPQACGQTTTYWPSGADYLGDEKNYYPPEFTKTATIPNGTYTPSTFITALQTAINAIGNSVYTVTWNDTTNTLNISSNGSGGDGVFTILANGYEYQINNNNILNLFSFQRISQSSGTRIAYDLTDNMNYSFTIDNSIVFGKQVGTLRWEDQIDLPSVGRYEVRVVNHNTTQNEFNYIDTFAIDYFSNYTSATYIFPYTAYLAFTFEANEQIGGSIPNITYIIRGLKVKNWKTGITEWTNNPLWCLIDFMINARYGLGNFINITDIDLTSAIEAADYCDELVTDGKGGAEKRYILDIVIDIKMEPKEIIQIMAQTCNLSLLYPSNSVVFKIDKPRAPVMAFDMDNIIKGSFAVRKSSWAEARTNRVSVQYQDKDNNYEREFAYKDDDTEQNKTGIIEKSINGYGITRRSQALRQAQLFMNANRTLSTVCSFKIGLKNLFAGVMDNVLISHDITGWVKEEFTILEIEEEEDEIMTITCVVYDVSVYDFTTSSITDPLASTLPNPSTATPHVEKLSVTEQVIKGISGDIVTNIVTSWQQPFASNISFLNLSKVEIFLSDNGGQLYKSQGSAASPAQDFAIQNVGEISDTNKISNYSFEEDLGQWQLVNTTSGEGILSRTSISPQEGQYSALINNINLKGNSVSGESIRLLFKQSGTFSVIQDNLYGIKFKARTQSGESRLLSVAIANDKNYGIHYNNIERQFTLKENWQDYDFIFRANKSKSGEIALAFLLGQSNKDVYLDSVRLHETGLYTVKALAYNEVGKPANILTAPHVDIIVVGKQIPPAQVANFAGGEYGNSITLRWDDLSQTEYDLAGYEIRRGATWNSGVTIDTNIVGTRYTIDTYKNGTQRYWIKAIDTSGNYSLVGSYIQINATNAPIANIIYTRNELQFTSSAAFSNTEMVWHEIEPADYKKCIALQTIDLFDETGDTWDSGIIYDAPIRTAGTYTTEVIDALRLSTAQLTLDIDIAYLTASGGVSISYEIRISEDNVIWSGWQTFAEGNYTLRYFQFRITWAGNELNNLFIYKLILNIDVPEFTLRGRATIATASAGASFTYSTAFINNPTLSITVISSVALIPLVTAESITGATVKLKDLSNVDSVGTFDWLAIGY